MDFFHHNPPSEPIPAVNLQEIAKNGITFVNQICYYGADNSYYSGSKFNRSDQKTESILCYALEQSNRGHFAKTRLCHKAAIALDLRMGRCGERTALLAAYLLIHKVHDFKLVSLDNHIFIAVGLTEETNLLDPSTVSSDALIIDPWLEGGISFPAKDFKENQQRYAKAYEGKGISPLKGEPKIQSWQDYADMKKHKENPEAASNACYTFIKEKLTNRIDKTNLPDSVLRLNSKLGQFKLHAYTRDEYQELLNMLKPAEGKKETDLDQIDNPKKPLLDKEGTDKNPVSKDSRCCGCTFM